jgi:hypothetical protein
MSRDSTLFGKVQARDLEIVEHGVDFLLRSSNIINCI